ncbi:MAG TPA: hypothetical protein PLK67_00880 [Bryobacteraceae bacterium]|nr:hypothetical protein [Bryobacteraceae bacterium]
MKWVTGGPEFPPALLPLVEDGLGTKVLPNLRAGSDLKVGVDFSVTV